MLKEFGANIRSTFEIGSSKATAIIRPCEELYGQKSQFRETSLPLLISLLPD